MKTIQYIAMNHPGTFRPHNQDSLVIPQAVLEERRTEPDSKPVVLQGELPLDDGLLFGVFDGLGGLEQGERASDIAARTALEMASNGWSPNGLQQFFLEANQRIVRFMESQNLTSCGSTAALVLFHAENVEVSWIGDSRIYQFRDNQLVQISRDHSGFAPFGVKPPLFQYLGMPSKEGSIQPEYITPPLEAESTFLLCTDGLSDVLSLANVQYYPEYVSVSAEDGWVELSTQLTPEILATLEDPKRIDFVIGNENSTPSAGTYLVDDVTFTVEPVTYALNAENAYGAGSYRAGTTVALTPAVKDDETFVEWTVEGIELSDEQKTQIPLVLTMPDHEVKVAAVVESHSEEVVNKTLLNQAIAYAKDLNLDGVNELVAAFIRSSLEQAEEVAADENATQEEVNDAWRQLAQAIQMAGFTSNKDELRSLVAQIQAIDLDAYEDDEAKDNFINALKKAEEVLADPKALDETSIIPATEALQKAFDELTPKPVEVIDTTVLEMLLNQVSGISMDDYQDDEAAANFQTVLEEAKAVLADPEDQHQVDDVVVRLHQAWLNLRLRPDESLLAELKGFTAMVYSLDTALFSEEAYPELYSFAAAAEAMIPEIEQGTKVLTNQEKLDLHNQIEDYVRLIEKVQNDNNSSKQDPADDNNSSKLDPVEEENNSSKLDPVQDEKESSEKQTTAKSVKTADQMMPAGAAATLAAAGLAVLALKKRQK